MDDGDKLGLIKILKLREKCPYSEFFWSAVFRIQTEHSPNAGKCGPEKIRIRILFMECHTVKNLVNNYGFPNKIYWQYKEAPKRKIFRKKL